MRRNILISLLIVTLSACATYKPQSKISEKERPTSKEPVHTFYVVGGLGTTETDSNPELQNLLKSYLDKANKKSTLLYTGDYLPENPDENERERYIKSQIKIAKDFKGKTVFIPGSNEWSSNNTKEIEWVEDYLKDKEIKNFEVQPTNVCPLEYVEIDETLDILYVDSNWFETNWDHVEGMNKKCPDINTKRRFNEEFEGYIKDSRGKNLLIVMHHPIFSNGKYAGNRTFLESITPLPIVGNIVNEIIDLGGFSKQRLKSHRYNYMRTVISSLVQDNDRVTIVSGHEQSLQYLASDNIRQIISGSLGKRTGTKISKGTISNIGGSLDFEGKFTYGENGFAVINYFEDGTSEVKFVTEKEAYVFDLNSKFPEKIEEYPIPTFSEHTKTLPITTDKDKLDKSGFYKFVWGDRYRSYLGTPVTANIAILDTLYAGLKITKQGGGHQSFSARLEDAKGKEYAMRGLEKDALKFLRFKVPGIAYVEEDFKGTFAETVVYDFFSTSHPYMQLVIDPIAKSAGVNHANPQLYYLPKQPGFKFLGPNYGDQLYFIEERPMMEQKDYEGYNRANPEEKGEAVNFESTTDVLEKLNRSEKYSIDQRAYIRARLFDMLIGDWDRHQDQWRWIQYEVSKDDTRFIPIPRDRDAAFSKFDGVAIPIIKMIMPDVRFWQSYDTDIKNVKWFNAEGNNLDIAFLNKHDASVWVEEAKIIQANITDEVIDQAFKRLPTEVQDEASEDIKRKLKGRLKNLDGIAQRYGDRMQQVVVIHGTHKDDKIEVTRLPQGKTKVVLKRLKTDAPNPIFFERTFDRKDTKELWIYGLNDDDKFVVSGEGDREIMVRLIGGHGDDVFEISNRKKLKVYDWKHEEAEFTDKTPSKQFTQLYETNTFIYREFKENSNVFFPNLGFKTDEGAFFGLKDTYTNHGFNGEDFRYKHTLSANYFFNFGAVEANYYGVYANIIPNWNFEMVGYYASAQFANNFFGYGNDTTYDEDAVGKDFNRARIKQIKLRSGIAYRSIHLHALFENYSVEDDPERYFNTDNFVDDVFETQNYVGAEADVLYENADAMDFPTRGLYFKAVLGYKKNLKLDNNQFGYAVFKLGFDRKLIPSGDLVLGSKAEIRTNFGDDYLFYHAQSVGGDTGLRGYRNDRFSGKTSFYQSTDLKWRLKEFVTAVTPITLGIFGGFDYGRVWVSDDMSNTWHKSYGGGFWLGSLNALSVNAGYFVSDEDAIIQIGLGFGF
ncbi:ShlB/FhaC/HecB family hemolysin secretion/activation protein [Gelidibacter sp.]|uniref:ShlB/FhaC/HecB family hemolysin secretion/activation protein n=1 Tax=Gelidibacter sp. TaxID=2018083 RepID=UPI002D0B04F4|nr:ShlB/FhaC/HecB family hemolysin secretion/activation protein [Gelidibacter sp.]HUH28216.1 ShlB/FhaC/HecB family hemolysin secretion/activation protein [Gelidibacter sp.]